MSVLVRIRPSVSHGEVFRMLSGTALPPLVISTGAVRRSGEISSGDVNLRTVRNIICSETILILHSAFLILHLGFAHCLLARPHSGTQSEHRSVYIVILSKPACGRVEWISSPFHVREPNRNTTIPDNPSCLGFSFLQTCVFFCLTFAFPQNR